MTVSRTICLGFMTVILIGTLLLMLPISTIDGQWNDLIVALFTSTSAVCVTGHIVVNTPDHFSFWGQLFILGLIQIGGLGYMTATTFLLILLGRRFGLRDRVAIQQSLDRNELQGVSGMVRSIIALTLIFEITGILLLLVAFLPDRSPGEALWSAIFHSVSAWNNAGFSVFSDNMVSYQSSWLVNLVVPGLVIFGGIGYEVILEIYLLLRDRLQRKAGRLVVSLGFKVAITTTAILLVMGTIAIFFAEKSNDDIFSTLPLKTQWLAAWFQSAATRTAGFNSIDVGGMSTTSLFIMIALMFIGGSPGGTAGGIKTTTLRVMTSCTKAILQGKEEVLLYERQLPISVILKAVGVVVGSVFTVIVMTALITFFDPEVDFIRVLFEVVSAFATVGLSTGITAGLSTASKLVLIATMYIGRVGVLLLMGSILGDPVPSSIRYPEENLLVG
ncbi:MAG: ATPase [Leptolyngbyaceae cyanobacterium SL_7_1]|nr:ATPase [Leptolyngbyaceae cyanobacterium SL_7_1]